MKFYTFLRERERERERKTLEFVGDRNEKRFSKRVSVQFTQREKERERERAREKVMYIYGCVDRMCQL